MFHAFFVSALGLVLYLAEASTLVFSVSDLFVGGDSGTLCPRVCFMLRLEGDVSGMAQCCVPK